MARGSVRADSGRMAYGSGKPVLGRKFCSKCGKWRHLCDFHVDERKYGVAIRFKHMCKTCFRIYEREKYAEPQYRERKREYDRIWAEGKRRAAGAKRIKPRCTGPVGKATEKVPNEPFRRRFEELERVDGLTRSAVAMRLGWRRPDTGKPDEPRVARALGLKRDVTRDRKGVKKHYTLTNVQYGTAVELVEVLGMDPHEAGI